MARKPNYHMERMERDRAKALKTAAKEAARREERERAAGEATPGDAPSQVGE